MEVTKNTNLKIYDIRNHYKVLDKVGKGTYGTVFKVVNSQDNKHYAIKKFQNTQAKLQAQGFPITALRQISLLKQINHINIINLREIICSKPNKRNLFRGSTFLVFDYMDHDFAGLFRSKIKFSIQQVKCFMKQILEGCNYLHQNKIMHRDIKSANILLNDEGIVQLADFGLGRRTRFDNMYTYKVVTLWYRAPQLLLGCKSYNHKVDVWSIGCVFAQFLLGQVLFRKDSQYAIIQRIYQICGGLQQNQFTQEYLKTCTYYQDMKPKKSYKNNFVQQILKLQPQIDKSCLHFLKDLLELNPFKRISCQQALDHSFFKQSPVACQPHQIQKLDYQYHQMFKDRSMKIQRKKINKQNKYRGWSEQEQQKNKIKQQQKIQEQKVKIYQVAPYSQIYKKATYYQNQKYQKYPHYNGNRQYGFKKYNRQGSEIKQSNYNNGNKHSQKQQRSSSSNSSSSSSSSRSSSSSERERSRQSKHKPSNRYRRQQKYERDYRQKRRSDQYQGRNYKRYYNDAPPFVKVRLPHVNEQQYERRQKYYQVREQDKVSFKKQRPDSYEQHKSKYYSKDKNQIQTHNDGQHKKYQYKNHYSGSYFSKNKYQQIGQKHQADQHYKKYNNHKYQENDHKQRRQDQRRSNNYQRKSDLYQGKYRNFETKNHHYEDKSHRHRQNSRQRYSKQHQSIAKQKYYKNNVKRQSYQTERGQRNQNKSQSKHKGEGSLKIYYKNNKKDEYQTYNQTDYRKKQQKYFKNDKYEHKSRLNQMGPSLQSKFKSNMKQLQYSRVGRSQNYRKQRQWSKQHSIDKRRTTQYVNPKSQVQRTNRQLDQVKIKSKEIDY